MNLCCHRQKFDSKYRLALRLVVLLHHPKSFTYAGCSPLPRYQCKAEIGADEADMDNVAVVDAVALHSLPHDGAVHVLASVHLLGSVVGRTVKSTFLIGG